MLSTHQYVKTHNGYEIYQRKPGFEFTPIMLGKIASFIVRDNDGAVAIVAFMYSMLIALEGESVDESVLSADAVMTIQEHIDAGRIGNRQELTFEYKDGVYAEASNPRWWIKSFE